MKKACYPLRIETERLVIESTVPEEVPTLMELENHPENRGYIWHNTAEEHLAELADPLVQTLSFKLKSDGRMIGYAINVLDYHSYRYELKRWAISEKGKGYGREALYAFMRYAFEELEANKFWLEAYDDNKRGRALYESSGLHLDGILRENYREERGLLGQVQYSMLAGEYQALKEAGQFRL